MFTAASIVTAKKWELLKYPSTVDTHMMMYNRTMNMNCNYIQGCGRIS